MSSYWSTNPLPEPPAHVVSYNNLRECLQRTQDDAWNEQCMKHYFRIYKQAVAAAAESRATAAWDIRQSMDRKNG